MVTNDTTYGVLRITFLCVAGLIVFNQCSDWLSKLFVKIFVLKEAVVPSAMPKTVLYIYLFYTKICGFHLL